MTINYWIFVTLVFTLTVFIGYGTFATARLLRRWQPDRNLLLLPEENLVRFLLILFCIMLGWVSGLPLAQLGWQAAQPWRQLGWGLVWGVVLAAAFYWSTRWVIRQTGQRFYSSIVLHAITPRTQWEYGLVLLAMAPVVFFEELLFRSLLIGGLSPLLPVTWLILGWSILFGLLHSPQGVWGMVGAGLAGLVLGVLFLRYEGLLTPSVAHYVVNVVQVTQAMRLTGSK